MSLSSVEGLEEIFMGAGILVMEIDDIDLANKIEGLFYNKDYYSEKAMRCLKRAKKYDISKMIEAYRNRYNQILQ